jgi:hypothetical protein
MDIEDVTKKLRQLSKQSDDNFLKLLESLKESELNKDKHLEIEIYKQMIVSKDALINNILKIFEDNYKKDELKNTGFFRNFK